MVCCAIKLYNIVFLDNEPYRPPAKKIKNDINGNKTKTRSQPTNEMMMIKIIIMITMIIVIIIITIFFIIIIIVIIIIIIIIIYYCYHHYYNTRYYSYSSLHACFDSDIRLS